MEDREGRQTVDGRRERERAAQGRIKWASEGMSGGRSEGRCCGNSDRAMKET